MKTTFVQNNSDALNYKQIQEESPLRGGTAFELYKYPYYISIGHGTFVEKIYHYYRYYTAHLIVLCVDPFRIV